jgi:hypothetical protein
VVTLELQSSGLAASIATNFRYGHEIPAFFSCRQRDDRD